MAPKNAKRFDFGYDYASLFTPLSERTNNNRLYQNIFKRKPGSFDQFVAENKVGLS